MALYNETDGPNWGSDVDWLTNVTPCGWKYVTCEDGHISTLLLSLSDDVDEENIGLKGDLPIEIGSLSNLVTLDLHGNQLTSVPAEISNLTSLTTLDLSDNQLVDLPTDFMQLAGLTSLNISNNHLTDVSAELQVFLDQKATGWADSQIRTEEEALILPEFMFYLPLVAR